MKRPSYPYTRSITDYAIQAVDNQFIIFGGVDHKLCSERRPVQHLVSNCISSIIASYNPFENEWRNLGRLKTPRYRHSVALVNNQFIVIGGVSTTRSSSAETYLFDEDEVKFSVETTFPVYLRGDLAVMTVPPQYTESLYVDQCEFL